MLKGIAAGFALSMMLVAGCTSSDSSDSNTFNCDTAKSKCPNDDPPDRAQCKQIIGDPTCGTVFLGFLLCLGAHQTCLADGTTDVDASARECAPQQKAAEDCVPPTDAGGGG